MGIEADEDVHEALERGLTERLGALGGKRRAGRSRRPQLRTAVLAQSPRSMAVRWAPARLPL